MRRHRTNYARILGIGLAISFIVHAAVLGFGRLGLGPDDAVDGPADIVSLPPENIEEELEEALPGVEALTPGSMFVLASPEVTSMDLAEYHVVLAEASAAERFAPVVPRPRLDPAAVETGLSPIHVREPALLTIGDRGRQSAGGGIGIGILVGVGGGRGPVDNCVPSHINVRYPNRLLPNGELRGTRVPSSFRMPSRGTSRTPVRRW